MFGMNTEITYKVFGRNANKVFECIAKELRRIENKLSRFLSNSDISKLNKFAGKAFVTISPETYTVLSAAYRYSEISQGLFDITVGPLIDLWDYKHASTVPSEADILKVLDLIDYNDVLLKEGKLKGKLLKPLQSIDLGGIGKGFASKRCIELLKKQGVTSAFINIGGNVSVLGNKPDGVPWKVGIKHPRKNGCLLGAIEVTDKSVVTSGDYERFFIDHEGKRWHHILNPLTGYPAQRGLISVTVVCDDAMTADALSTAIFIAGKDKGVNFLSQFPGAGAILVDDYLQVYITEDLVGCFHGAVDIKINQFERRRL